MNRAIRQRFDRAGASYESVALVQREVATELATLCPARLSGPVLEIGAGSGLLTRLLAPRRTDGPYVALDISPGMLGQAAMPGAVKVAADGELPPFRPGSFAFLASASALHWYGDPARSIPADLRLLAPGGGFALAIIVAGTLAELAATVRMTGFGSVLPLRETAFYRRLLEGMPGLEFSLQEARHEVVHPSVVHLLRSLKGAGVTHTPGPKVASAARYREFTRYYGTHFATPDGGVRASYAVAYFRGRLAAAATPVSKPRFSSRQA
jgi:malonyl-CoA O-methyltransferase